MPTLWICFVFLYQTYQSPISLHLGSFINLCLSLIFAIRGFVGKQLSKYVSEFISLPATLWFTTNCITKCIGKFGRVILTTKKQPNIKSFCVKHSIFQ